MIPIDKNLILEKKKEYDDYIQSLKGKIKKYHNRGYVKNRGKDSNGNFQVIDPFSDDKEGETKVFFKWLSVSGLEKLAHAQASELEQKIKYVERKFPTIKDKDSILYKNVYHAFVTIEYNNNSNFSKENFLNIIGIKCCPYCNRVYIHTVKGKNKTVKAEIDHFYIKEKYPYLALSFYNLIPSCSFCNGASGKHDKDCMIEKIINPYDIKDDEIKFTFDIKNIENYYSNNPNAIRVKLNTSKRLSVNNETFHLADLYATHDDHAMELIFKSQIKYPITYRKFLQSAFSGLNLTEDEVNRLIVGNYINKEDFHKRPLSKLYYDIAKELDLID
jgi:hypothetical protein